MMLIRWYRNLFRLSTAFFAKKELFEALETMDGKDFFDLKKRRGERRKCSEKKDRSRSRRPKLLFP